MVLTQNWLPIGSVVHVTGSEGLCFRSLVICNKQLMVPFGITPLVLIRWATWVMIRIFTLTVTVLMVCMAFGFQNIDGEQWQNYLTSLEPEDDKLKARVMSGEHLDDIRAEEEQQVGMVAYEG